MPIMIFLNAFIFPFISELLLCIYILTPPLVIIYAYTTLTLNYKLQMAILKISALQILAMFISIIMIIASLFGERGIFSQNPSYNYQLKALEITNIAENMYKNENYKHLFNNNIIKLKDLENIENIKDPYRVYYYHFDYKNSYIEIKENNQELESYIYLKNCKKNNKKCYILSSNSKDILS